METALGWLGTIFRALIDCFPHAKLVRGTHGGVRFRNGGRYLEMTASNGLFGTGLHVYWPLMTDVDVVPIKRQTVNLPPQYLTTTDGQTVGVSAIIIFEVADVVALLTESWDYNQVITDYGIAEVKSVIGSASAEEIAEAGNQLDRKFTRRLRRRLRRFGVRVIRVTLSDFAPCMLHGLMNANLQKVLA